MFDVKIFLKLRVVNLQQIKIEKDHSQNQKRRLVYTESTVKTLQTDNSTIRKLAGLSRKLAGHLSNKSSYIILFYLTHFPTKSSQLIFLQFAAANDSQWIPLYNRHLFWSQTYKTFSLYNTDTSVMSTLVIIVSIPLCMY